MTKTVAPKQRTTEELSEALAEAFRTGEVGDVFTDDIFLDGHPPFWRFQLAGIDTFAAWLHDYSANRPQVDAVRTIATESGFVTEHVSAHEEHGELLVGRKLLLCAVRDGQVSEMTVFCSGDWDAELRARHASEAPILRP
jgi:hypothetical protein